MRTLSTLTFASPIKWPLTDKLETMIFDLYHTHQLSYDCTMVHAFYRMFVPYSTASCSLYVYFLRILAYYYVPLTWTVAK